MLALVFDTETTGLLTTHLRKLDNQPYLIEFYGCVLDLAAPDLKLLSEYHTYVKPDIKITEEIYKITKLDDSFLANKPKFAEVSDTIKNFLESGPVVISHNFSYDQEIMDIQYERLGQKINWPQGLCTVEQTIHIKGRRMTLTELHSYLFGQDFLDAHRASVDTEALVRCCRELVKRGFL